MEPYRRILLKISGEALAGPLSFGLDAERVKSLAAEVAEVARAGVQMGLVLGGGNIFRGGGGGSSSNGSSDGRSHGHARDGD